MRTGRRRIARIFLAVILVVAVLFSIPVVRKLRESFPWILAIHEALLINVDKWMAARGNPIEPIDPEDVLRRLVDPPPDQRFSRSRWFGVDWLGERAAEPLVALLSDDSRDSERQGRSSVRESAIYYLQSLGSPAVPALVAVLQSENPLVRAGAAEALSAIPDPRNVEPLAALLDDPDPQLRRWAFSGLRCIRDERTIKLLARVLQDTDAGLRFDAAKALADAGDPRGIKALLLFASQDENPEVRFDAAVALAYCGDPSGSGVIASGMTANRDDFDIIRRGSAALAALPSVEHCRFVLSEYRAAAENRCRSYEDALKECAALILPELTEALRDPGSDRRYVTAEAMRSTGDRRVIEPFLWLIDNESGSAWRSAMEALGEFRNPEGLEAILESEAPRFKRHVKDGTLGALADPRASKYLVEVERGSTSAQEALVSIGDFQGVASWFRWTENRVARTCEQWRVESGYYHHLRTPCWAEPCPTVELLHLRDIAAPFARRALIDPCGYFRPTAVNVLADGRDREVLDALLDSPRFICARQRWCYYSALARYEDDDRVRDVLADALFETDVFHEFIQIAPVLARMGEPRLVTRLADWVSDGKGLLMPDWPRGGPDGVPIFEISRSLGRIRSLLASDVQLLMAEQARFLGTITNPDLIAPLADLLGHVNPVVRTCAAESLRHMDDPRAQSAYQEALEADGGWRGALWWWQRKPLESPEDPKALIRLLSHEDWRVREAATQGLTRLGPEAVDHLLTYVAQHHPVCREDPIYPLFPGNWVRDICITYRDRIGLAGAATALGEIGDPRAAKALWFLVKSDNWLVRLRASEALLKLGENISGRSAAIRDLDFLAKSRDQRVRARASARLAELAPEKLPATLLDYKTKPIPDLLADLNAMTAHKRFGAATALIDIGEEAVPPLIGLLETGNRFQAAEAAYALGKIRDARAYDPLVQALSHPDVRVRARAAEALGWLGDRRAIGPLERFRVGKEGWELLAADWALDHLKRGPDEGGSPTEMRFSRSRWFGVASTTFISGNGGPYAME